MSAQCEIYINEVIVFAAIIQHPFSEHDFDEEKRVGVITGLAWTQYGGATLKIEIAMTGEISLTGEVLPIGGLKEKLLAAKRNEVPKVLIPEQNRALYGSIEDEIKSGIEVVFVKEYSDVFKVLFG